MADFAKIFDTAEHGQILVICDTNHEDGPTLAVYLRPSSHLVGLSHTEFTFHEAEDCEAAFDSMDEASALLSVEPLLQAVKEYENTPREE